MIDNLVNAGSQNKPKTELKEIFSLFLVSIDSRIVQLNRVVKATEDYYRWNPDCSKDSLKLLGNWFYQASEYKPRSEEKIKELAGQFSYPVSISQWELTEYSLSIAVDVGIYFAKTLMKRNQHLRRNQFLTTSVLLTMGSQ